MSKKRAEIRVGYYRNGFFDREGKAGALRFVRNGYHEEDRPIPIPNVTHPLYFRSSFLKALEALECREEVNAKLIKGFTVCPTCGKRVGGRIYTSKLLSKTAIFTWPSSLFHQVKEHNVIPPFHFYMAVLAWDNATPTELVPSDSLWDFDINSPMWPFKRGEKLSSSEADAMEDIRKSVCPLSVKELKIHADDLADDELEKGDALPALPSRSSQRVAEQEDDDDDYVPAKKKEKETIGVFRPGSFTNGIFLEKGTSDLQKMNLPVPVIDQKHPLFKKAFFLKALEVIETLEQDGGAVSVHHLKGWTNCPVCGQKTNGIAFESSEISEVSEFKWYNGLAHYVRAHGMLPPFNFYVAVIGFWIKEWNPSLLTDNEADSLDDYFEDICKGWDYDFNSSDWPTRPGEEDQESLPIVLDNIEDGEIVEADEVFVLSINVTQRPNVIAKTGPRSKRVHVTSSTEVCKSLKSAMIRAEKHAKTMLEFTDALDWKFSANGISTNWIYSGKPKLSIATYYTISQKEVY